MTPTDTAAHVFAASILLVHSDRDLVRVLTHVLERRRHEVFVAHSGRDALALMRAGHEFDAVVADWDPGRGVGQSLYDWSSDHRPELCASFVALASVDTQVLYDPTRGRCQIVHSFDLHDIARSVQAMLDSADSVACALAPTLELEYRIPRSDRAAVSRGTPLIRREGESPAPSVLLVDDEPLQREILTHALEGLGFTVRAADSSEAAVHDLTTSDYDVILSDWYLTDGSAAALYSWLVDHRPDLADRCVFMSARSLQDGPSQELARVGPGRPLVSKSGGTNALLGYLRGIAGRSRARGMSSEARTLAGPPEL